MSRGARGRHGSGRGATGGGQLAFDEGEGGLTVLGAVALVDVGVAAGAAVRVGRVAVAAELGGAGAVVTCWPGGELEAGGSAGRSASDGDSTYALCGAGTDVVG